MPRPLALALVSLALIAIAAVLFFRVRGERVVAPALELPSVAPATTPTTTAAPAELELAQANLPPASEPEFERALDAMSAGEREVERASAHRVTHAPGLSLRGRVMSLAGKPIVGANVRIRRALDGGALAGTSGFVGTTSGLDGTFMLSGLTPGDYVLDARAKAHSAGMLQLNVPAGGAPLADVEVVLTPTATLSGRMLDENDAAIPGVFVYAMPVGNKDDMGPIVSTASREDGSFTVPLDADARHWLWTEVGRYSGWESWRTATPDFAPNSSGIEIRVARTRPTRVFAADAVTREKLPRFGLNELSKDVPWRRQDERALDPLALQRHTPFAEQVRDGVPLLVESPPQRVVVWADGYAVRVHTLSSEREQTVWLERLGGLRGSFARHGAPLKRAKLIVRTHAETARNERGSSLRERSADAASGGEFQIDELPPGEYDVFAHVGGRGATPRLRAGVVVEPDRVTDLGELDLGVGSSTVRLELVLPADVRARDYWMLFDFTLDGAALDLPTRVKDSPDLFEYDDLPAGRFEVVFAESAPLFAPARRWSASLTPGSAHELKLDLSDVTLCDLTVVLSEDSPHTAADHVCVRVADSDVREIFPRRALIEFGGGLSMPARGSRRVVVDACDAQHHPLSSSGPIELPRTGERKIVVFVP